MYNYFCPIFQFLLPCKIVMVFYQPNRFNPHCIIYFLMDFMVVVRSIFTCKVHGNPVFNTFFGIQVKPGQMFCLVWQV